MYLKALEIQGFKSFPDKTVLTFDRDVTAIVGPNGSGKSNISDAVRWVLGEQSTKQLRGSKMEDVIFGGTPKRSQMGFAEVSLILDNADSELAYDAKEIMVTRRYYRSGEGEYFINKQAARLKDISELFMDTGLGRDGYSNISQGRVDEILSLKSTDRREIFEEAAGISKYRYRKQEAERRLAGTEANLLRLSDKLAELELQVGPLETQAKAAKKYLQLRDELKGLEVSVWLRDLNRLSEQARKSETDYAAAAEELEKNKAELDGLYDRASQLAEELRRRDEALQAIREEQQDMERRRAETERECAVLRTNCENNTLNIQRLGAEMDEQAGRAGSIARQIEERKARLAQLAAMEQTGEAERVQVQAAYDALAEQIREKTEQLLELAGQQRRTDSLIGDLKESISGFAGSEQALLDRETAVLRERGDLLERRSMAQTQLEECGKQREAAEKTVTQTQNQLAGFELRRQAREKAVEDKNRRLNELAVERRTVQAKADMLQEMQREYEGYGKAVKLVLQERDRGALPRVHGPVPELLRTRDDYTVAIETALGGAMQNIVVDTQEDAKAGMRMLQNRRGGRATFLPLSVMEGKTLSEKGLDRQTGFVGIASDLIEYDAKYDGVMRYLLGRTVIADTLDHGIAMANAYGRRFKIVTLDGQVLNAGGSMTGGSASQNAGVLSRANEVARLEEHLKALEEKETAAKAEAAQAQQQLMETRRQSEAAREAQLAAQDELAAASERYSRQQLLLQTMDEALESARQELEGLGGKLSEGRSQSKALEDRMAELVQQQTEQTARSAAVEQEKAGLEAGQADLTEQLTTLRLAFSARQAERQAAETSLTELENLQTAMAGDETRRQAMMEGYRTENESLQRQIDTLEQQARALTGASEEARQKVQQALEQRAMVERNKTAAERQQQEVNKNILLLERECARLEQRKTTAELEERQLTDKLWDNYELTPATAEPLRAEVTEETSKRITTLRRQISALGTPNLGAIEEFERVNERYTYLTTQRDDVIRSRDELVGVIDQITGEMTAIFGREFIRIRDSFRQTFTELFRGGKADLILEDPDNILECGIEIQVQPPGKQLKTITLLSGGEKAFVAIALYFAILRVRPTPFCILDEIDAALDDRNVTRFIQYLRQFTTTTQFVLITHRRGTMEGSDVLYGVTMTDQGVSRMLTLNLNQVEEELNMKAT